eukprot:1176556-Prorocentrum_minimum.AAC.1
MHPRCNDSTDGRSRVRRDTRGPFSPEPTLRLALWGGRRLTCASLDDFVALRVQHLCSCVARGAVVRLVACVDGPWGKPVGQALGAARWGWTSWDAGDGPGGTTRWSEDRWNDCEFVMVLGASPWGRPMGLDVIGRLGWPLGHHSVE